MFRRNAGLAERQLLCFTGPGDRWNANRTVSGPDSLLFWDYTGEKVVPNIARGYEFQDGGRLTERLFQAELRAGGAVRDVIDRATPCRFLLPFVAAFGETRHEVRRARP